MLLDGAGTESSPIEAANETTVIVDDESFLPSAFGESTILMLINTD